MNQSPTIGALATALAKANLKLSNPTFDKRNSHFNNGYASLAAVLNAIRQPLAEQGLSLVQTISTEPGHVTITTSLLHASGEWLSSDVSVSVQNNATAQAVGGATTYMRRYSALAMCGIAGDDDDAEEDRRDREERKPMAAPTKRPAFKPQAAKGAPPVPTPPPVAEKVEVPAPASDDGYPDEYEGDFDVVRIAERPGKPIAIAVVGEHGNAWLATTVAEYAELARKAQDAKQPIRLHVDRVGDKLEIMRVIGRKEVVR
jgi:hypothetical protein